jgi:hypothetical protein
MKITITISKEVADRLSVLGDPKAVINQLIDHAQQGVYRPGSWERGWLQSVPFPNDDWEDRLEVDPKAPMFERPRKASGDGP